MICWARYLFILVVAVLGIGQMIAACGQKGDLYLPPPESESKKQDKARDKGSDLPQVPAAEEPTEASQ